MSFTWFDTWTKLCFSCSSYNCAGKGLWTEWISLSTPPSLPGVPTCPPRLLPKSSRTVHISWDPVTCINGAKIYEYRLEYRQYYTSFNSTDYYNVGHASNIPSEKTVICNSFCTSLDSSSGIDSTEQADSDSFSSCYAFNKENIRCKVIYAGPKLSFELTDLQPATLFAFRFCAVNTAGAGPWSPIAKCWTPSAPPDQPHGLCIHDLNSDSALILWVAPQCNGSPITSYTIEITQFGHIKSNNKSASGNRIMPLYPDVNYIQIPAPCLSNYNNNQIMNSIAKQQHPFLSVMDTSTTTVGANTTATTTHNNSNNNNTQSQKKMIQHYLSKLKPSTTYILRIQAVNKFGPSEYSANIEFTTLAPLPRPPVFSQYTNLSSNTVKLEWNLSVNPIDSDGDTDCIDKIKGEDKEDEGNNEKLHVNDTTSSSPHHHGQQQTKMRKQKMDIKSEESQITFTLQISREPDLEWTTIYEGQANVHKVNRLCEFTVYHFRVCATNTTGSGSYSTIQTIRTQKSSPPAVRGLKILELSPDRCQLEWTPVNQLGMDPIVYLLHLLPVSCNPQQSSNLNQVYRGNQSACRITGLNPGSEYVCRVCAVRLCQPNKLPVVINGSPDNEQSKVNSSTDSSQYQITELPGPFSPGLVFTTPRPHKDSRCDSTLPNYHLFQQHSSCKQSSLLRILSLPFRTIRRMYSCGGSSNTSAYSTHDSSSSITPTKHDMIHSNQVIATGTSTSSSLVNNASDKRRTVLVSATSSSSSSVLMATIPRNQSKQSSSRRSHSSWFRFTDTQLACLLLILFSLATLLVAMSLQYVLNIHLKISNHPSASSSIDSSYEVKLRNNEDNSDSSLFIASTDNDYDHFREYHP
ncbi:unnamed protein product [Heterobilharzia americana]|nr:unnamed protein product [Heterobilharzia americana]